MKKILLIEDDPDITEIVRLALAGKYIVKARSDNQDLLVLLEDFQPDLIMIDYYIGQKKATEIMGGIKSLETHKDLPFILFSGHHDIQNLAGTMGATAWLAKPFSLAELYSTIENVFQKS